MSPYKCGYWSQRLPKESELLYDWRFTAIQFILAPRPLRLTTNIFSTQNTCSYSPYITSSLKRGRVCNLQFLLGLARAVILGTESRGTRDPILLSQIRDSPKLEGQVSVHISPRDRVARLYPRELSSYFVASYGSQGYGGGIRTSLVPLKTNYFWIVHKIQFVPHKKHISFTLQNPAS
jgi:hypothetical protein